MIETFVLPTIGQSVPFHLATKSHLLIEKLGLLKARLESADANWCSHLLLTPKEPTI